MSPSQQFKKLDHIATLSREGLNGWRACLRLFIRSGVKGRPFRGELQALDDRDRQLQRHEPAALQTRPAGSITLPREPWMAA